MGLMHAPDIHHAWSQANPDLQAPQLPFGVQHKKQTHYGHKSFSIDYELLPPFGCFRALHPPKYLVILTGVQSCELGVLFLPPWLLEMARENHLHKKEN